MKRAMVVTGLDLGSAKISAVTARVDRKGATEIMAHSCVPSKGISRGMITSFGEASRSIGDCLAKIVRVVHHPGDIYVNVSGETVKAAKSIGMVPLAARGREVTKHDIEKCASCAATVRLPFDRELVHKIVHKYSVDDQPWIDNPMGLYASRLSCEAYVVTAAANHIQNIIKCVNSAGQDVKEVVFTGIADSSCLLDKSDREGCVMLADMGSEITEVCVFLNGRLCDLEVITSGAKDIKGDFRDNPSFLSLMGRLNSKIEDAAKTLKTPIRAISLTGGMALSDDVVEFMEERLSVPVRMGIARDLKGDISSVEGLRLTTAIGLVRYAAETISGRAASQRLQNRLISRFIDLFNEYF